MGRLSKVVGLGLVLILFCNGGSMAVTDIMGGAMVEADPEVVKAILSTFDRAEEALRTKNLPGITAVYSKDYQNRGLRKEETALIWKDIFARYNRLSSRHLFTKIVVDRGKGAARVTCTGALYGVSILRGGKPAPTSAEEPTHIDVWFEAVHYLILEDGAWKIIGHDPAAGPDDPFGAAIHLLF